MASNRHLGRIVALQSLYEYEFRTQSNDESADVKGILRRNLERYEEAIGDTQFVEEIVEGVLKTQASLDETIQPVAPDWPIEQIARIDRAILRIGVFELIHRAEAVPPKVAINEAVELAKAFGSDNSSKFVNGVLGTVYRTLSGEAEGADNGNATVR